MGIMSRTAKVVEIHFRITDQIRDMIWPLDKELRFSEAIPELQVGIGDKLIAIEKEDVRNLRCDIVRGKLMTKKFTTFTSIRFIKNGMEDDAEIVFAGEKVGQYIFY